MAISNHYQWKGGAELEPHSKAKLRILKDYLRQYLLIRCALPKMSKLRMAIVDGFCGGGRYACGAFGSPLLFIETTREVVEEINIKRAVEGINTRLHLELFLILNDKKEDAFEAVKYHCEPYVAHINENVSDINLTVDYRNFSFEDEFQNIFTDLQEGSYKNVLFNLDQYGYKGVWVDTIKKITSSFSRPEIFLTFSVDTIKTYYSQDQEKNRVPLNHLGVDCTIQELMDGPVSTGERLGIIEKFVFNALGPCAKYVSPFAIHNPKGWKYWLIHFSQVARARQAYNDVLHQNSTCQAHYGKAGLDMLFYDPSFSPGQIYLFEENDRNKDRDQLLIDIPKVVTDLGRNEMLVEDFYRYSYNRTAAHSDDLNSTLIKSRELEVHTGKGGTRSSSEQIKPTDLIVRVKQKEFLF